MSLLDRIKITAKEKGLTLTHIERELNFGNSTMRKWDKNSPSLDKVVATANLLNVSLHWLITGKSDNDTTSEFLCKYNNLSNSDKQKINHFIEIASLDARQKETVTSNNIVDTKIKHQPELCHDNLHKIAVLGYVAAGLPIEGISIPLGYIENTIHANYALIARGHSMEPAIRDGEYIFIQNCSTLNNNDIGIFYIDGEVTCKRYYLSSESLILKSLNPDFKPFVYPLNEEHDFKIQGKVLLTKEQLSRLP